MKFIVGHWHPQASACHWKQTPPYSRLLVNVDHSSLSRWGQNLNNRYNHNILYKNADVVICDGDRSGKRRVRCDLSSSKEEERSWVLTYWCTTSPVFVRFQWKDSLQLNCIFLLLRSSSCQGFHLRKQLPSDPNTSLSAAELQKSIYQRYC